MFSGGASTRLKVGSNGYRAKWSKLNGIPKRVRQKAPNLRCGGAHTVVHARTTLRRQDLAGRRTRLEEAEVADHLLRSRLSDLSTEINTAEYVKAITSLPPAPAPSSLHSSAPQLSGAS